MIFYSLLPFTLEKTDLMTNYNDILVLLGIHLICNHLKLLPVVQRMNNDITRAVTVSVNTDRTDPELKYTVLYPVLRSEIIRLIKQKSFLTCFVACVREFTV